MSGSRIRGYKVTRTLFPRSHLLFTIFLTFVVSASDETAYPTCVPRYPVRGFGLAGRRSAPFQTQLKAPKLARARPAGPRERMHFRERIFAFYSPDAPPPCHRPLEVCHSRAGDFGGPWIAPNFLSRQGCSVVGKTWNRRGKKRVEKSWISFYKLRAEKCMYQISLFLNLGLRMLTVPELPRIFRKDRVLSCWENLVLSEEKATRKRGKFRELFYKHRAKKCMYQISLFLTRVLGIFRVTTFGKYRKRQGKPVNVKENLKISGKMMKVSGKNC